MACTRAVGCRSSQNKYWFTLGAIRLVLYDESPGSSPGAAGAVTFARPNDCGLASAWLNIAATSRRLIVTAGLADRISSSFLASSSLKFCVFVFMAHVGVDGVQPNRGVLPSSGRLNTRNWRAPAFASAVMIVFKLPAGPR